MRWRLTKSISEPGTGFFSTYAVEGYQQQAGNVQLFGPLRDPLRVTRRRPHDAVFKAHCQGDL